MTRLLFVRQLLRRLARAGLKCPAAPDQAHPRDVASAAKPGEPIWCMHQRPDARGRPEPRTGRVERIPPGVGSRPHGVITGPDGPAWMTPWLARSDLDAIVRMDATARAVKKFPWAAIDKGARAAAHQSVLPD